MGGWIGVDLDGTLAHYEGWGDGGIGEPILPMIGRVRDWLLKGREVRIVTARANMPEETAKVREWLDSHGLQEVGITSSKDFGMIELWDDRAVTVERNTGRIVGRNED